MSSSDYVLVTPAKNEEKYIEKTLESVVAQTIRPRRWVIVSDGSTDRTDEIVSRYAQRHGFISLLRRESGEHSFASKVFAFQAGCRKLDDVSYDFIGNLDADIELPSDYYERLLDHFATDEKLGLTGGTQLDLRDGEFVEVGFNEINFGGAFQLFRRSCYEDIGGYMPLEVGGTDTIAGVMARYRGWRVRAFRDIEVRHHRPTGTAQGNVVKAGLRRGKLNFLLGYHPVFEYARLLRLERPKRMLYNFCEFAGFTVAAVRNHQRQVPDAVVAFLRAEQLGRLRHFLRHFHDPASGERKPHTSSLIAGSHQAANDG